MHAITQDLLSTDPKMTFVCECCQRKLNPETMTWLELNSRTGEWAKPSSVDWGKDSQGCFPFGVACSKRKLKAQKS